MHKVMEFAQGLFFSGHCVTELAILQYLGLKVLEYRQHSQNFNNIEWLTNAPDFLLRRSNSDINKLVIILNDG